MSSQGLPNGDEPGAGNQPADTVDEFGPDEPGDSDDLEEYYEPALKPEPILSDATHDRLIVLLAAMFALATVVLFLGITQLSTTGIFGADCGSIPTNRSARCYQAGYPNPVNGYSVPASKWYQPVSITIP